MAGGSGAVSGSLTDFNLGAENSYMHVRARMCMHDKVGCQASGLGRCSIVSSCSPWYHPGIKGACVQSYCPWAAPL